MRDRDGDAPAVLANLLATLDLPGAGLLDGSQAADSVEGGRLVEPVEHHVARFDAMVADNARLRAEMEER
jgi:hypothetical protein